MSAPAALLALLVLAACAAPPSLQRYETVVFGTRVVLQISAAAQGDAEQVAQEERVERDARAANAVFAHFEQMHRRFHAWRDGELLQLNERIAAGALPMTVSAPMARMLRRAQGYARDSEGLFNPAIGALVRLWGFHADTLPTAPPAEEEIATLTAAGADMGGLMLQGEVVRAAPPAVQLDFGALAKGVALDEAREILAAHGVRNALLDIGGNILALGDNNGAAWRVAIAPDRDAAPAAVVALRDGEAIATSGGGERYFIHDGTRYHHILDPRTGYPAKAVAAATVIAAGANAGAVSDALATALVIADDATAARLLPRFGVSMAWRAGAAPTPALQARLAAGE